MRFPSSHGASPFFTSIKSWDFPLQMMGNPHDLGWDMLGPLRRCDIIDRFFIILGGSSASTGDPQAEDINLEQNTRVLVA
jgi:hypothetical protein